MVEIMICILSDSYPHSRKFERMSVFYVCLLPSSVQPFYFILTINIECKLMTKT